MALQQQKPEPRRHAKRTMGELVVAGLLLLWGGSIAILMAQLGYEPTRIGALARGLWVLQGVLCGFGGLLALLRLRTAARLALSLASLCLVGLIGFGLWLAVNTPQTAVLNLIVSAALLGVALVYFSLGRWLGRQEDSED